MLINGSALNRAAINGPTKRGATAISSQVQTAAAVGVIAYAAETSQTNGSTSIFRVVNETLIFVNSGQAQTIYGAGGEIISIEVVVASQQAQKGQITLSGTPNDAYFGSTVQSVEAIFSVDSSINIVSIQGQTSQALFEPFWLTDSISGQVQLGSATAAFNGDGVSQSSQLQETDVEMLARISCVVTSSQGQTADSSTFFGLNLHILSNQVQVLASHINAALVLEAGSSTSQGTFSVLHWPRYGSTQQAQRVNALAVRAIAAAMQSSQSQVGQAVPINYMPSPSVSTCYVPAFANTVMLSLYLNGVIVPPESPDAIEAEENLDVFVPEYGSEASIYEIENSAAVPA